MRDVTIESDSGHWGGRRVLVTGRRRVHRQPSRRGARPLGRRSSARSSATTRATTTDGWSEHPATSRTRSRSSAAISSTPRQSSGAVEGCDVVLHLGALIPIPYSYQPSARVRRGERRRDDERPRGRSPRRRGARSSTRRRARSTGRRSPSRSPRRIHSIRSRRTRRRRSAPISSRAATGSRSGRRSSSSVRSTPSGPGSRRGQSFRRSSARRSRGDVVELGSTDTTRDFRTSRTPCAESCAAARRAGIEGEVINLGTGVETSVADLVRADRSSSSDRDVRGHVGPRADATACERGRTARRRDRQGEGASRLAADRRPRRGPPPDRRVVPGRGRAPTSPRSTTSRRLRRSERDERRVDATSQAEARSARRRPAFAARAAATHLQPDNVAAVCGYERDLQLLWWEVPALPVVDEFGGRGTPDVPTLRLARSTPNGVAVPHPSTRISSRRRGGSCTSHPRSRCVDVCGDCRASTISRRTTTRRPPWSRWTSRTSTIRTRRSTSSSVTTYSST